MFTVQSFGTKQVDLGGAEIGMPRLLEQSTAALQNGFAGALGFGGGVDANDHHAAGAAVAQHGRGRHLVLPRRRAAFGTIHPHLVRADLADLHLAEITGHIRQQVSTGVANFIQQLLGHRGTQHTAACASRLADLEAAVGMNLHDGVADLVPVGDVLPVGVQTARGLTTAFDDVTCQAAAGELVQVLGRPAKFVNQGPQADRAVDTTPGDDDVGTRVQSAGNRSRPQIRIGTQQFVGQGFAAEHVAGIGGAQRGQQGRYIVAFHHRDAWL